MQLQRWIRWQSLLQRTWWWYNSIPRDEPCEEEPIMHPPPMGLNLQLMTNDSPFGYQSCIRLTCVWTATPYVTSIYSCQDSTMPVDWNYSAHGLPQASSGPQHHFESYERNTDPLLLQSWRHPFPSWKLLRHLVIGHTSWCHLVFRMVRVLFVEPYPWLHHYDHVRLAVSQDTPSWRVVYCKDQFSVWSHSCMLGIGEGENPELGGTCHGNRSFGSWCCCAHAQLGHELQNPGPQARTSWGEALSKGFYFTKTAIHRSHHRISSLLYVRQKWIGRHVSRYVFGCIHSNLYIHANPII